MTLDEIRGLATDDLKKKSAEAREEMFKKRFQTALEAVDNTTHVRELRKRVARIQTVIREREIADKKSKSAAQPATTGKQ